MEEVAQEENSIREIPASEILAKIEKGEPVEYDHKIIKEEIDIYKINLPKDNELFIISSPIRMTFCTFLSDVNLSNSIFTKPVIFGESTFEGNALFAHSVFEEIKPEDRGQLKANANYERQKSGDYENVIMPKISGNINFNGAKFCGITDFNKCKFLDDAFFNLCEFKNNAIFNDSYFNKYFYFRITEFYGDVLFFRCKFEDRVATYRSRFYGNVFFVGVIARSTTGFNRSVFYQDAIFNFSTFNSGLSFEECQFDGLVDFYEYKLKGEGLSFKNAIFKDPRSQEEACRRAKNVLERGSNREDAGYHFYREMEARRMQRPWYYRYPEFVFIQLIFGYGVHPFWLIYWWLFFCSIFALIFAIGNGINGATESVDYLKFSLGAAFAPGYVANAVSTGYTGYQPTSWYQVVAWMEAIFGTFMWAAFIATFARKYMR